MIELRDAIAGCILGTALGDSIGLPVEGLSRRRQQRLFPALDGHRLIPGRRGMVSDDTEHTCLVAEALCVSGGDAIGFQNELEAGLRWWLLGLPAGIGFATLRATLRLWLGLHPSGVFSAGNGPAMRSALLGLCYPDSMQELVRVSTRITHTDPKAEWAAYAVALAAHMAHRQSFVDPHEFSLRMRETKADEDFLRRIDAITNNKQSTLEFAESNGVSGYCYHCVPVALHAWLHHQGDFRGTVLAAIHCGGDTDTTGAIAGAIAGAQCGASVLPQDWLRGLCEWPRTVDKMMELSTILADTLNGPRQRPRQPLFPAILARNAAFTAIVVGHILRRMSPL